MGLVQLFRAVPCPDLMARHLLDAALADFCESGHHHLMMLVTQRDRAFRSGNEEEKASLDAQICDHLHHEQLPERWNVDFLFSRQGYETYGDGVLAVWATVLIEICTLEQHWEGAVLGYAPENPYLLAGFHPEEALRDTAWLEEAQRLWSGGLEGVMPDAAKVLRIVVLPPEPDDPAAAEEEDQQEQQPTIKGRVELHAADAGPFVH